MADYLIHQRDLESAADYQNFFKDCPERFAQQSVEWGRVIAPLSPDRAFFLLARSKASQAIHAALPLYHFTSVLGGVLTSVPHAGPLGGPLFAADLSTSERAQAFAALLGEARDLARKIEVASLTLIENPFSAAGPLDFATGAAPSFSFENFCQALPLQNVSFEGDGRISLGNSELNNRVRRNIKKSIDSGVSLRWGTQVDFASWYQLHVQRHAELGISALPEELLRGILTELAPVKAGGLLLAERSEKIVGGCLYIWTSFCADAFIISSDRSEIATGINYHLTAEALRFFKELGVTHFNWQSSQRNSGVYKFKEQWGCLEKAYRFLTWTFDPFQQLLKAGPEAIKENFAWHYVAPFAAIQERLTHGSFRKN